MNPLIIDLILTSAASASLAVLFLAGVTLLDRS